MATAIIEQSVCDRRSGTVPPLENGDRLTRAEFERRYEAMPELKKAELIEGVVYMPSPVRFSHHGEPQTWVVGWLFVYKASTPGVRTMDNTTVRLDLDADRQRIVTCEPTAHRFVSGAADRQRITLSCGGLYLFS